MLAEAFDPQDPQHVCGGYHEVNQIKEILCGKHKPRRHLNLEKDNEDYSF